MQGKGFVFVTGDHLGDQLTALLEEAGCPVVRGPQPRPPALTIYFLFLNCARRRDG